MYNLLFIILIYFILVIEILLTFSYNGVIIMNKLNLT